MSIKIIIDILNTELKKPFLKVPGFAIYGVSELFQKKNKDNSVLNIPGISDENGEIKYVGIDDKNPIIIYHRLATASQTERTGSSYGDDRTDVITTYNNSLFVYADRKVICSTQTDLLELIQTALPDAIVMSGYKNVIIKIMSVNFNTQTILRSEYSGSNAKLKPERLLIQINYQIETTFRKKCAARCA